MVTFDVGDRSFDGFRRFEVPHCPSEGGGYREIPDSGEARWHLFQVMFWLFFCKLFQKSGNGPHLSRFCMPLHFLYVFQ